MSVMLAAQIRANVDANATSSSKVEYIFGTLTSVETLFIYVFRGQFFY
jgi:hypothetical protein